MKKILIISRGLVIFFFLNGLIAGGLILGGCANGGMAEVPAESENKSAAAEEKGIKGVILPHHLIVEKNIEKLYSRIAANNDFERVIILSPNHFHHGLNFIQTTDRLNANLDKRFIGAIAGRKGAFMEPKYFEEEHGITVHLPFIKKYFPKAKVVPVIMKKYTPHERLEHLIEVILKQGLENTLVIASIDFSHYADEKSALADDAKTVEWLKEWSEAKGAKDAFKEIHALAVSSDEKNPDTVAVDSPESLYVIVKLMEAQGATDFIFHERTSSAANFGVKNPAENTSHIFGTFGKSE